MLKNLNHLWLGMLLSGAMLLAAAPASSAQVIWPYGPATADSTDLTAATTADTLTVSNTLTLFKYKGLDTSLTLSTQPTAQVRVGSMLFVAARFSSPADTLYFAPPYFVPDTLIPPDTAVWLRALFIYDGQRFFPVTNY